MTEFIEDIPQPITYAVGAALIFGFLSVMVLVLTWLERKALARIQQRMGPMRVGPHGTLPAHRRRPQAHHQGGYPAFLGRPASLLACALSRVRPSLLLWVTIPITQDIVLRNMDMGLFYITAFSVLTVLGLVMAGWGSANKYAILGGLRAAGQLVSYEVPFIMALLAVAMLSQSLNIVESSTTKPRRRSATPSSSRSVCSSSWWPPWRSLGRTPFDIHHAESEVVGGPFVEYSGAHWAVFFLAEYINTFTVAALTTLLFLGGWRWPDMPFDGPLHTLLSVAWFLVKTYAVILVIFWIRGTYPRLRIDQLMAFRLEGARATLIRQHHHHRHRPLLPMALVPHHPDVGLLAGRRTHRTPPPSRGPQPAHDRTRPFRRRPANDRSPPVEVEYEQRQFRMRPSVYLETTIPSYLTARRSRDLLTSARQIATQEWWTTRADFELYVSQLVIDEASAGDEVAAMRRLDTLADLPVLDLTEQVDVLAQRLIAGVPMPEKRECGCLSHRHRGCRWNGLSANMEHDAHCECSAEERDRPSLSIVPS